jgi:hypothetical protein
MNIGRIAAVGGRKMTGLRVGAVLQDSRTTPKQPKSVL